MDRLIYEAEGGFINNSKGYIVGNLTEEASWMRAETFFIVLSRHCAYDLIRFKYKNHLVRVRKT